jgi:FkbM family methyltransferase
MGARVLAVDPDDYNQETLRLSFLSLRISPQPVIIVGKAVSDADSTKTMWIEKPGSAKNTLNTKWVDILQHDPQRFGQRIDFATRRQVDTVTLETLIRAYGSPYFIKIDVEGHEPDVLRGLRRPVPYISFEVNLPEFRAEGHECVEILSNLLPTGRFNYAVDCMRDLRHRDWVARQDFLARLDDCSATSIEVFWTSLS